MSSPQERLPSGQFRSRRSGEGGCWGRLLFDRNKALLERIAVDPESGHFYLGRSGHFHLAATPLRLIRRIPSTRAETTPQGSSSPAVPGAEGDGAGSRRYA